MKMQAVRSSESSEQTLTTPSVTSRNDHHTNSNRGEILKPLTGFAWPGEGRWFGPVNRIASSVQRGVKHQRLAANLRLRLPFR